MAEIIGTVASAITLVALFKSCMEAFDMFRTAQHQAIDLRKLTLRLNIEKCRLYTWGQVMGLTANRRSEERGPLARFEYADLVHEMLELIIKTLSDSSKLRDKYGCRSVDAGDASLVALEAPSNVLQKLNASFDNFKLKSQGHARQTVRISYWGIHDRQKFEGLVLEAKGLIDGLQDITQALKSEVSQQGILTSRIRRIDDVRTLDWISEVCEAAYPLLSDAASAEAESLSENRTVHRDIEQWKDDIDSDSDTSSTETTIAALEDMTVAEIKHKFSTYLVRAKEARLQRTKAGSDRAETASLDAPEQLYPKEQTALTDSLNETSHVEYETNQQILADMAQASMDKEFEEEVSAIMQWFDVLSPAEQTFAFYKLGEVLHSDADRTRFFARIQSYRVTTLPSLASKPPPLGVGVSWSREPPGPSSLSASTKRHGSYVMRPPPDEVLTDLQYARNVSK